MAVSGTVALPAQPASGSTDYVPLGGDGKSAPIAYYIVNVEVAGDASGGTATTRIDFDTRYTSVVTWLNFIVDTAAAAPDFLMFTHVGTPATQTAPAIVSTAPFVATTITSANAAFLWYPPPILYSQRGNASAVSLNVGVNETYGLRAQIYVFDADVAQLAALEWLYLGIAHPGAPGAV